MNCPKCGAKTYQTVCGGAWNKDANEYYRKRVCQGCGKVFFTVEFAVEETPAFKRDYLKCKTGEKK